MRVINKEEFKINKKEFFEKILKGAVFVYPTDTIYGLGCSAKLYNAVKKIREIKERYTMPFSVIAPSKKWIMENCFINEKAKEWLKKLPGPYTLILKLKNKDCIAPNTNIDLDTLGIRIPDHWFSKYVKELGVPVITTSANITGGDFMTSLEDLDLRIKENVDFIVYEGELKGRPSAIVDLTKEKEEIIRK